MPRRRRTRGGQPGNQNARKHGFRSDVLTPAQQRMIPAMVNMKGLYHEIDVARTTLISIMAYKPINVPLVLRALGTLRLLVLTQEKTGGPVSPDARETIKNCTRLVAEANKVESS